MGDTDRTPSGLSGGSRALAVAGVALYEAGRTIIGKGIQLAAHLLEVSAQDVRFADGVFSVPGTDLRLDIFAVAKAAHDPAKRPAGMEPGLDTTHHPSRGDPHPQAGPQRARRTGVSFGCVLGSDQEGITTGEVPAANVERD
jgi:CO/xanthine dehydrogenase Mo-binding subunit